MLIMVPDLYSIFNKNGFLQYIYKMTLFKITKQHTQTVTALQLWRFIILLCTVKQSQTTVILYDSIVNNAHFSSFLFQLINKNSYVGFIDPLFRRRDAIVCHRLFPIVEITFKPFQAVPLSTFPPFLRAKPFLWFSFSLFL